MRVEKAIEGSTLKLSREFKSGGQDENRKKEERKNLSETNNTTKENSIKFVLAFESATKLNYCC